MPCPHFSVTIVSRAKGSSAVAGASYQSGEKLFFDQPQRTIYYPKLEGEVVLKEIMLPENAPAEYADREKLWNAVEDVETQWNAQLARRFHITLPRELPLEQSIALIREYCEKEFCAEGMCVDLCVHDPDPPGYNPHAHVMLTMRSIDEDGRFMPKAKKEYMLDENGEKIRMPSGGFKSRKVYPNNWNDRGNVEHWRHEWEVLQNKYLERAGVPERVDMRSYEKQGIDKIPTVHMGAAVAHMEKNGIRTNIGDLNREIKRTNSMISYIKNALSDLVTWIAELHEKHKRYREVWKEYRKEPRLVDLIGEYYQVRSDGRDSWNSSSAKLKWAVNDLNQLTHVIDFLNVHQLYRLSDLHDYISSLEARHEEALGEIRPLQKRMKELQQIKSASVTVKELKPIHDAYIKINWKKKKEKYASEHRDELKKYNSAYRFLKKMYGDKPVDLKAVTTEYKRLEKIFSGKANDLETIKADLKELKTVRYYVSQVLPEEPEPEGVSLSDKIDEGKAKIRADEIRKKKSPVKEQERQIKRPTRNRIESCKKRL